MKELRGLKAVMYAEHNGLRFLIDENLLVRKESEVQGRGVSMDEIDILIEKETGQGYEPAEILKGSPGYDFLLNRYGEQWIYMPLEGNHPQDEEAAVLGLFEALLDLENPRSGGDVLEIASQNPPKLHDTGFSEDAEPDLVFHAARRLAQKGLLEAVTARPAARSNYGNTYFFLPPDVIVPAALCDRCRDTLNSASLKLHRKCAERLNTALGQALQLYS